MRTLFLDWHLGLGDAIVCNGMVRVLTRSYEVHLPCYTHNCPSVAWMFSDLDNVHIVEHGTEQERLVRQHCDEELHIGMSNPEWGRVTPFDRAFYDLARIDFNERWDSFHIPVNDREAAILLPASKVVLIHEDQKRGYLIDESRVAHDLDYWYYYVTPLPRISDYRPLIAKAAEIHCIDSAFIHLVDSVPTAPEAKLFYHQYARPAETRHSDAIWRKPWEIIK